MQCTALVCEKGDRLDGGGEGGEVSMDVLLETTDVAADRKNRRRETVPQLNSTAKKRIIAIVRCSTKHWCNGKGMGLVCCPDAAGEYPN